MSSLIAVVISDEEVRKNIVKVLSKNPSNVITSEPFVPDILSFLKSGGFNVAIIDGNYLEKIQDVDIVKNSLPATTSIIAWINKYDAQRAVSLISSGALDVLAPPLNAAEVVSVIGYHLGGFYLKRKSDFYLTARLTRNIKLVHLVPAAVLVLLLIGYPVLKKGILPFYFSSNITEGTYLLNVQSPTGVWVERGRIYVSDWLSQSILGFVLDSKNFTGDEKESYYLADCNPLFVSKCGEVIFTAASVSAGNNNETTTGIFHKYSINKKDGSAVLVEKFPSPGPAPSGFTICIAGNDKTGTKFAYSVDSQTRKIYQHLSSAGYPVVSSYDFAGISPVGIVYDGKYFYIADSRGARIYKHIGPANNFVPVAAYNVRLGGADKEILGFYKDRGNFYIVGSSGGSSRLYVIKLK